MRESRFERQLVGKLQQLYPNCVILKNDSSFLQGVPDRLILHNDRWAMLEVKADVNAPTQPNQPYYVDLFNEMSFAAFVHPGNEEDVLHALQFALGGSR